MNAWPILWWTLAVFVCVALAWWWRWRKGDDDRDVDDSIDAGFHDHRDPCDTAGGLAGAHSPDLLVPPAPENDGTDLGAQPVSGGILTSVTNLGDPYTEAELRTTRIFDRLETRIRSIIMSQADDAVKAAVEQLNKARGEVLAQDVSQEDRAVSPETLQSLRDAAQAFDDLNPDPAPEPDPVPVPDPEPTPDPEPEAPADGETPSQ